jgi:hypothetical protein
LSKSKISRRRRFEIVRKCKEGGMATDGKTISDHKEMQRAVGNGLLHFYVNSGVSSIAHQSLRCYKLHQFFIEFFALIIEQEVTARFKGYQFCIPYPVLLRNGQLIQADLVIQAVKNESRYIDYRQIFKQYFIQPGIRDSRGGPACRLQPQLKDPVRERLGYMLPNPLSMSGRS